jgi:hypothetical protein
LLHWHAEARGGKHVLQRAPAAYVHVHVARRHERQAQFAAELLQRLRRDLDAGAAFR